MMFFQTNHLEERQSWKHAAEQKVFRMYVSAIVNGKLKLRHVECKRGSVENISSTSMNVKKVNSLVFKISSNAINSLPFEYN